MQLFFDPRDDAGHEARGSRIRYWLDDLGAQPLSEARPGDAGFLFTGARPIDDYRQLVAPHPLLCDQPEERDPIWWRGEPMTLAALWYLASIRWVDRHGAWR